MNKQDLYRHIIISNSTKPKNLVSSIPNQYQRIVAISDTCSESYDIFIKQKNNNIIDAKFNGSGCSISKAALNIICSMIKNKTINESIALIVNYKQMIYKKEFDKETINDLIVFENISVHINRVNCALLGANKILEMFEEKIIT